MLLTNSQQLEILESHIHNLTTLFIRNRADRILGIYLAYTYFTAPENTTILGSIYNKPYYHWARTTIIETIDLSSIYRHIFVLTDYGFYLYKY
jgi:hypothetical protein